MSFSKKIIFALCAFCLLTPGVSFAEVASQAYVDENVGAKQTKPSSGVANGKVLTYTGSDANTNVSAAYIQVPVATAAPSTVTPTGFIELWVQP